MDKEQLINELSNLTVLEMSELKTALEDKWGVKAAAAAVAVAAAPAQEAGPAAAESTDFEITLTEITAEKKIAIIKVVREVTGLGLKEAKELVENTPRVIKETAPKVEANEILKKVEDAGGKAKLKGL